MRRYLAVAASAVIAALILPVTVNIATSSLPASWEPYLWLAWPVSLLLALVVVLPQLRRRPSAPEPDLAHALSALALGVRQQWTAEMERQDLHGQALLRLGWSADEETGDVDAVEAITTEVRAGKQRQVVVLGGPGAGKTVLAMTVVLDLLAQRDQNGPVPVLLPIAQWHPDQHLHEWIAERLAEDYTGIGEAVVGALLTVGLVLPVLDGLDEMPAAVRPKALLGIERAVGDAPVVLMSRVDEYREAVATAGRVLVGARELTLARVGSDVAIDYMTLAAPDDSRWAPVVAHMRADPGGPLATALSSPLMAWLARTAYRDPRTNPADLVTEPDQESIERRLLVSFIDSRYRVDRPFRPTPGLPRRKIRHYDPEQAAKWLGTLARYLQATRRDTFMWWDLRLLLPHWLLPVVCGVISGLGGAIGGFVMSDILLLPACAAVVLGFTSVWNVRKLRHGSMPTALARRRGGGLARLRANIGTLLRTARYTVMNALVMALPFGIWSSWTEVLSVFASYLCLVIPYELVTGMNKALSSRVEMGTDVRAVGPLTAFRANRSAELVVAIAFGLSMFLLPIGYTILQSLIGTWAGVDVSLPSDDGFGNGLGLLIGFTVFRISTSEWFTFTIARIRYGTWGVFPYRLMRFLADAHERGVLRQAGIAYEFRHVRLRDALAEPTGPVSADQNRDRASEISAAADRDSSVG